MLPAPSLLLLSVCLQTAQPTNNASQPNIIWLDRINDCPKSQVVTSESATIYLVADVCNIAMPAAIRLLDSGHVLLCWGLHRCCCAWEVSHMFWSWSCTIVCLQSKVRCVTGFIKLQSEQYTHRPYPTDPRTNSRQWWYLNINDGTEAVVAANDFLWLADIFLHAV